jgi:hypothetical protein
MVLEGSSSSFMTKQMPINVVRHVVFKFSKDVPLAEEITLGKNGKNVFLQIVEGNQ